MLPYPQFVSSLKLWLSPLLTGHLLASLSVLLAPSSTNSFLLICRVSLWTPELPAPLQVTLTKLCIIIFYPESNMVHLWGASESGETWVPLVLGSQGTVLVCSVLCPHVYPLAHALT